MCRETFRHASSGKPTDVHRPSTFVSVLRKCCNLKVSCPSTFREADTGIYRRVPGGCVTLQQHLLLLWFLWQHLAIIVLPAVCFFNLTYSLRGVAKERDGEKELTRNAINHANFATNSAEVKKN